MNYESAVASGKVKPLRLAFLKDNKIVVESVDHVFSDEYFAHIGICSYTWGHDRVDWYDDETGLTWKISDRAEDMCRAALELFDKVWLDGICMVQEWQEHIGENMKFMGKLYFHGTVVAEMIIGLKPEYCYRGWVQQEISFTKMACVMKPLKEFLNSDAGKQEVAFMKCNALEIRKPNPDNLEPFKDRKDNQQDLLQVLDSMKDYLLGVQRILQGRNENDLEECVSEIYMDIDGLDFYLCEEDDDEEDQIIAVHYVYNLFNRLIEKVPSVIKLHRELNEAEILMGAISSFRTGFFRFNSDRIIASFSLAEYVTKKSREELLNMLDVYVPATYPEVDVVIANPGRWCTGISATTSLRTIFAADLGTKFHPFLAPKVKIDDMSDISLKSNLDKLFSIIHSVDVSSFEKYDYVMGYKRVNKMMYSLCFGLKPIEGAPDMGLCLINIQVQKNISFFVSNTILGSSNEWMLRMIALLNASYNVFCLGANEHRITHSPFEILCNTNLASGDYFTPIFRALRYIEYLFGVMANYVTFNPVDGELVGTGHFVKGMYQVSSVKDLLKSVKEDTLVWGSEDWEHYQL